MARSSTCKVLTPIGWRQINTLASGSLVVTPDGRSVKVARQFSAGYQRSYDVVFSDGAVVTCSSDELWLTRTSAERKSGSPCKWRSTSGIKRTLKSPSGFNHSLPLVIPSLDLSRTSSSTPVDAYFLGACLASPMPTVSPTIKTDNPHIVARCTDGLSGRAKLLACVGNIHQAVFDKEQPDNLGTNFRQMSLAGIDSSKKKIPGSYLFSDKYTRWQLLQGLLDVAGLLEQRVHHGTSYSVVFRTKSATLSDNVRALVLSLGGVAMLDVCAGSFQVNLALPRSIAPFSVDPRFEAYGELAHKDPQRKIVGVYDRGDIQMTEIVLDEPSRPYSQMYVSDDFVVSCATACA